MIRSMFPKVRATIHRGPRNSFWGSPKNAPDYRDSELIVVLKCYIKLQIYNFIKGKEPRAVGIATGYGLDDGGIGVRIPVGSRIFSSPLCPDLLWGPPSLLSNGYREFSSRIKRQGREADHSFPTSAEVKKMWIYTSTPPYAFIAYYLIS
jgi:hypothetical protein